MLLKFSMHIAVRCLIMNSFLCMDWKSQRRYARYVPKCFILGPFILGLNDPIHHKDFGQYLKSLIFPVLMIFISVNSHEKHWEAD